MDDSYDEEDDAHHSAMLQLTSILYCRATFKEFRRPVLAAYPNLAENYLNQVKEPMDLGTLLLQVLQRSITPDALRQGLHAVCDNALRFNAGYPTIEAITHHLEHTAQALYEELLCAPYTSQGPYEEDFYKDRRLTRCQKIRSMPLNLSELNDLLTILRDFPAEDLPGSADLLTATAQHIRTLCASGHVTLVDALAPIASLCSAQGAEGAQTVEVRVPFLDGLFTQTSINSSHIEFVLAIDDLLGVYLILLEERFHRGNICSTVWAQACPLCLWAPLDKDFKKRPTWWPCIIIGSGNASYPMHPEVLQGNVQRIPVNMVKQLLRSRPRDSDHSTDHTIAVHTALKGTDASSLRGLLCKCITASSQYLLAEFLGDHQLGWVKEGVFRVMTAPHTAQLFGVSDKICSTSIIEESKEVFKWLQQWDSSHGEPDADQQDLTAIPALSVLIKATDISEANQFLMKQAVKKHNEEEAAKRSAHLGSKYRWHAVTKTIAFSAHLQKIKPLALLDAAGRDQKAFNVFLAASKVVPVAVVPAVGAVSKVKRKYEYKVKKTDLPDLLASSPVEDDIYREEVAQVKRGKPLEAGCSRYLAGEGLVYTRKVDFTSALFYRESVRPERRKMLLKKELELIAAAMQGLAEDGEGKKRGKDVVPVLAVKAAAVHRPAAPKPASNGVVKAKIPPSSENGSGHVKRSRPLGVSDMLPF